MTRTPALIVEDEIFVALDLERILMDAGFDVVGIAADKEEALQHAGACEIAFVDVNLRDGPSGPEVARHLAREFGVKVVFVTANPAQIGASVADATCYVRKPFAEDSIQAAALIACERAESAPEASGVVRLSRTWAGG
jgi:two-component system, response regulator PdtaR